MPGTVVGYDQALLCRIAMNYQERALCFPCHDFWLYGILSQPEQAGRRGVLIVVGGPQYRVGSHRQFTLLARDLAVSGVPVMRFDYRGMGDSEGEARTFEHIEDDLRCAIDCFLAAAPSLKELVIWGLCDAASAALFYAHRDPRVTGLVLLNPWARTEQGSAKAYLKHYYAARLFRPELWSKIWRGQFDYAAAGRSLANTVGEALGGKEKATSGATAACAAMPLPEQMFDGLSRFEGEVLLITSGNDLTAQEFLDLVKTSRDWQKLLASERVQRFNLAAANHTFSRREWRDQVAAWTREWLRSW